MSIVLHSFFRSSAAWRVRIALAWKGLRYDTVAHNFRHDAQRAPAYMAVNPQGLVPALEIDGHVLTQSLAIIEYLEERHPAPPLLPTGLLERGAVRAMAQLVACDIHPVNNLRILARLQREHIDAERVQGWVQDWIAEGFAALEVQVRRHGDGTHCFGDGVTMADLCLVPQMANARRYALDLAPYPTLSAIDAVLADDPAFAAATPEKQPDAV